MRRGRPPRCARTALLCLAAILALAQAAFGTSYVRRLSMPTQGDGFLQPRSVHADLHTGEVFVCDTLNNRVAIFDERGLFRYQIVGGSVFDAPTDIAVDPEGYLFLVANREGRRSIVKLDFDGRYLETVTLSGLPEGTTPPVATSIAISAAGDRLAVVDNANDRLWITDREGRLLAGADLAEGLTEREEQEQILGHVDAYGDLVLATLPTYGKVLLFDFSAELQAEVGRKGTATCKTAFPVAAALDGAGRVMVLDRQRARFMLWEPNSNRCLSEHSHFGNAPGAFYQPGDLALDGAGRVYVSQGFEARVQVFEGAHPAATVPPIRVSAAGEAVDPAPRAVEPAVVVEVGASESEPSDVVPKREPTPSDEPSAAIAVLLSAWALAWTEQRIGDYLAAYSPRFRPRRGMSRGAWEGQRRERLARPAFIEVEILEPEVELIMPDRARATFVQRYRSNLFQDEVRKRLELVREGDDWRIAEETVLEVL